MPWFCKLNVWVCETVRKAGTVDVEVLIGQKRNFGIRDSEKGALPHNLGRRRRQ
jgi:hypothetical protein